MANQPAEQSQQQNNMSVGAGDNYYSQQMQGAAQQVGMMGSPEQFQTVNPFSSQYIGGAQLFAPGLQQGMGNTFAVPTGDVFGQTRQMMQQAYDPTTINIQRDLMLQSARQANLQGQRAAEGQLAQMGLGSLGGQAGLLTGQAAQGAMNEQQAILQGQQMAQMAAQGAMQAQQQMQALEGQIGDSVAQAYGSAYDVVTATAPRGYKINEALEADLANFANLLGQQVLAGQMTIGEMQMQLATYADRWSQATGLSKYRRHDMSGNLPSPEQAYTSDKQKQAAKKKEEEELEDATFVQL